MCHNLIIPSLRRKGNVNCGMRGCLMVSALDFGSSGPGSGPGRGHYEKTNLKYPNRIIRQNYDSRREDVTIFT